MRTKLDLTGDRENAKGAMEMSIKQRIMGYTTVCEVLSCKSRATKNTTTVTTITKTTTCMVLECGHIKKNTDLNMKVGKSNKTDCYDCYVEEYEKEIKERESKII